MTALSFNAEKLQVNSFKHKNEACASLHIATPQQAKLTSLGEGVGGMVVYIF